MIELGKELYCHTGRHVRITGTAIGKLGIAAFKTSVHRGGAKGAPKMSSVGTLFDLILEPESKFSVYEDTTDEAVYVEFDVDGARILAHAKRDSIRFHNKEALDVKYTLIPSVCYELSSYGENEELKELYSSILKVHEATKSIDELDVINFCDSYYYGCAKEIKNIEDSDDLEPEQVKAAFRSGSFKVHPLLRGKNFAMSIYDGAEPEKKTRKKKKEEEKGSFLEDCKSGKYRVAYEWPEELKGYIKPTSFLNSFEPTTEFEELVKKIKYRTDKILERMDMGFTGAEALGKDYINVLMLGKPGTGKTTIAYALSAATGIPVCSTVHTKHTDEDEYEGKTKIIDGKPSFVKTDSLIFHELGGIEICEEINLADPSVTMGGLGQKLEYPFIVKENGYKTTVRHPLNIVIATMNVGTNGSNPLNQALANRFNTSFILDDPTDETFINILEKATGKGRDVCEWVYEAYAATKQYLIDPDVNEEEICQNLSIRTCIGAISNMDEGQEPIRALINSIVGAVAVVDLEVARNLQRERIEYLPNPKFAA